MAGLELPTEVTSMEGLIDKKERNIIYAARIRENAQKELEDTKQSNNPE